jgi:hypothetical protein
MSGILLVAQEKLPRTAPRINDQGGASWAMLEIVYAYTALLLTTQNRNTLVKKQTF